MAQMTVLTWIICFSSEQMVFFFFQYQTRIFFISLKDLQKKVSNS